MIDGLFALKICTRESTGLNLVEVRAHATRILFALFPPS